MNSFCENNILNCTGECYICNLNGNALSYFPSMCSATTLCINKTVKCSEELFSEQCKISTNAIKAGIIFIELILFNISFRYLIKSFNNYNYNINKQLVALSFHTTINLITPIVLLFTTNVIYLWYCIFTLLSFIYIYACIPHFIVKKKY